MPGARGGARKTPWRSGVHAVTHSRLAVIGGILTIAIADAFSDALGIHISEESENIHTPKQIWTATIATFLSKFVFASTFIVPVLFLELQPAVLVSILWGLGVLSFASYGMAKEQEENAFKVVGEHLLIAAAVIIITYNTGRWISANMLINY